MQNNNLDDFMPKELQEDYFLRGLESLSKVMEEDAFENLHRNIILINRIGDHNYEI